MADIRLVVVDDHALFRAGLINLLREMDGLQIVGEANDGRDALNVVERVHPDVVLLDVNMPGMGGVETVKSLRSMPHKEQPRILMLTISKSEADLFGAIEAGADGYMLKNAEPSELYRAIQNVHMGLSVLSPQVTRQILKVVSGDARPTDAGLSEREMDVLECLARGLTTAQISDELYISDNTVKTHVRHILEKLQASNRAEAVSKALQMGILRPD